MVEALTICNECPVSKLCLKQGLEDDNLHTGSIWGGLTSYERRVLTKKLIELNYSDKQITDLVRQKVKRRI